METIDDIKKLTSCLENKDQDLSDVESVNSDELIIDCQRFDIIKNNDNSNLSTIDVLQATKNPIINKDFENVLNKCVNPDLKKALECNLKKRKVLFEIISQLEVHLQKLKEIEKQFESKPNYTKKNKITIRKRLGAPFFKDPEYFPSPLNSDCYKMKGNKHNFDGSCCVVILWTPEDKYNLANGVYTDICNKKLTEIQKKIDILSLKCNNAELELLEYEKNVFSNTDLINSLISKWQLVTLQSNTADTLVEKISDEQLIIRIVSNWNSKIDWLKISSQNLNGRHNDTECKAMWDCYLNPKNNKEPWRKSEDKKLISVAENHKYENWEKISEELNIGKSAFQCCIHFHAKLCDKFTHDRWTPEENIYLKKVVDFCSRGDYISWGKVAYYFKNRTKNQIMKHYYSCLTSEMKKGKFSVEEDILLLILMKIYEENMRKAKQYFPNRSMDQLRLRLRTLKTTDASRKWTIEDDVKIIEFVAKHGCKKWSLLDLGRSPDCVRHRYNMIRKWFEQHPKDSVENIPRRGKRYTESVVKTRYHIIENVVKKLLSELETKNSKEPLLKIDYIKEVVSSFKLDEGIEGGEEEVFKVRPPKTRNQELGINNLIMDFFKSSYKSSGRWKFNTSEEVISETASRIKTLLQMFQSTLEFPDLEEIENHSMLDDTDKMIIKKIMTNKEDNETTSLKKYIPVSVESLTGFRGLLLQSHILRKHARGKYEGYSLYVRSGPNAEFTKRGKGINYSKSQLYNSTVNFDTTMKEIVLKERNLFAKRLKMLFQWSFIIAETKTEPPETKITVVEEETPKPPPKRGRKPKSVKNYKIAIMNKAKLEKKKAAMEQVNNDSEIPKKKLKTE